MLYRLFEDGSSHVEVFVVVARMSKRRMRSLEEATLLSLRELKSISNFDCIREVIRHCVFRYLLRIDRHLSTQGQDFQSAEEFHDALRVLQEYEFTDRPHRQDHKWIPIERYFDMYATYKAVRPWVHGAERGQYFEDIDEKAGLVLHKHKVYLNQLLDRSYVPASRKSIPTYSQLETSEEQWSQVETSLLDDIQEMMVKNVDLDRMEMIRRSTLKGFLRSTQQHQPERSEEMMETDSLPSISMKPHPEWHGNSHKRKRFSDYHDRQGFETYSDFLAQEQNRQVSGVDVRQGGWDESKRDRRHQRDFDDNRRDRRHQRDFDDSRNVHERWDDSRRDRRHQRDFDDSRNVHESWDDSRRDRRHQRDFDENRNVHESWDDSRRDRRHQRDFDDDNKNAHERWDDSRRDRRHQRDFDDNRRDRRHQRDFDDNRNEPRHQRHLDDIRSTFRNRYKKDRRHQGDFDDSRNAYQPCDDSRRGRFTRDSSNQSRSDLSTHDWDQSNFGQSRNQRSGKKNT